MVTHGQDGSETPTHALLTLYLSPSNNLLLLSFHCLCSRCTLNDIPYIVLASVLCFSPYFPHFSSGPRVHELYLRVCLCSKPKPTETLCLNPKFRQAYLREKTAKSSRIETMEPYTECSQIQFAVLSHIQVEQGSIVYTQLLLQRRVKQKENVYYEDFP